MLQGFQDDLFCSLEVGKTQQQLNDCCGGDSQIGMTKYMHLICTCSTTVQTSASDDLLNHGISALGECM